MSGSQEVFVLRGILIAIILVAGCVGLVLASAGKHLRSIDDAVHAMEAAPAWSPFARSCDTIVDVEELLRPYRLDHNGIDAFALGRPPRHSRYVYPSSPCS